MASESNSEFTDLVAEYGEALLERLSDDLTSRYGRGIGVDNLQRIRLFCLAYPPERIYATVSR